MARPKGLSLRGCRDHFAVRGLSQSDCWGWSGGVCKVGGYGKFKFRGQTLRAPRVSLQLKLRRQLKPDEVARHTCHNPVCCNPRHLVVGSHQQNMWDKVKAGRTSKVAQRSTSGVLTRLSPETRKAILQARDEGLSYSKICDRVGETMKAVRAVVNPDAYKAQVEREAKRRRRQVRERMRDAD